MSHYEFTVRCDCMDDHLDVDFFVQEYPEEMSYWSIGSKPRQYSLRRKLWICWTILRGKEHWFAEVTMPRWKMQKLSDWLDDALTEGEPDA